MLSSKSVGLFIFVFMLQLTQGASAGLLYNYNQLKMKDIDEMSRMVRGKVEEARRVHGSKAVPLKEAVQAIFSRPTEDNSLQQLLPQLRTELEELNAWEKSIEALVQEAIGAIKNPRPFNAKVLLTYQIFLENFVRESKAQIQDGFMRGQIEKIRDAKIILPQNLIQERQLTLMSESVSPSELADRLLMEAGRSSQPSGI